VRGIIDGLCDGARGDAVGVGRPRRVLGRHLACFRERSTEDLLRGLVVEDEPTVGVGDQRGGREIGRELTGEDEDEVLGPPALLHERSVRR
jgi:hypothetical protein